jgi:hypothetical protein
MPSPTTVVDGINARWGVSDCGQLMGQPNEAGLVSKEPEGTYEHLAVGVLEEGYTLAYRFGGSDHIKYDVYGSTQGIVCLRSSICRDDRFEFVKVTESETDDGAINIRQHFVISKNHPRVCITMHLRNCFEKEDLTDLLVKRYADIDVDTGGTAGWAGFRARWNKNRYSVFTYNLDQDVHDREKRAHIVNMVAMPSDLPLSETFVGQLGAQQYRFRNNPNPLAPLPTGLADGAGVLQWGSPVFRSGETYRIHMYYDAYRTISADHW